MITCLERAELLALLCDAFFCILVAFLYYVPGQVWYLMVLIPDLCFPLYFNTKPTYIEGVATNTTLELLRPNILTDKKHRHWGGV